MKKKKELPDLGPLFIVVIIVVMVIFTSPRLKIITDESKVYNVLKELKVIREEIEVFYRENKRYPTKEELLSRESLKSIEEKLEKKMRGFPSTPEYTVSKILVEENNNIEVIEKLKELKLLNDEIEKFYGTEKEGNEQEKKRVPTNRELLNKYKKLLSRESLKSKEEKLRGEMKGYLVSEILVEENNEIKVVEELKELGLDEESFTSKGGWLYSEKTGEFRANLQLKSGKDIENHASRPKWGENIDWYYE